ncbi:hypothetical protein ELI49_29350 (plasmid) [Rhizobium ruizarguesonis]|jgi:hypothetical protein|uniref:hypothetical protein n=1 Tax=Rhizobium ruizarguesonis TaxID=2081791 RepID=UPI0010309E0B|nr:hypothetical protein [Rhizobium ruizarguesonis]MBY5877417.1 hypothetical protein [Rhizobium leguminosarum]TBY63285.1 hypothetical protein E0H46_26085 [Rhizobium leguminosarum bv. viciae]NEH67496.1 hypothetical protein [Rhizobium ruizarguesonis]NEI24858.1 hypothetical protein [Rhizobium ruizarguesonis]NEI31974.1 hypothetical protein [Rhizobium ruizarguesonis]
MRIAKNKSDFINKSDGMPPSWRPNQRHLMRRDCLKAELGRRYALAEKRLQITLGVATMKGSNPEKMSGSLHLVRFRGR